jgi:hypothetical protein
MTRCVILARQYYFEGCMWHEEPQKPSDLPDELKPTHPGRAMKSNEKKVSP